MSCDYYYERKKVSMEVGLKKGTAQASSKRAIDDKELLAQLVAQEKIDDRVQVVSFDSPTSD